MTDTVMVACKLINGLVLEVDDEKVALNGYRTSRFYNPVNGTAPQGAVGLTRVDARFWNAWLERHRDYPLLLNGAVFAQSDAQSLKAQARELENHKTGLEGIDPAHLGKGVKADIPQPPTGMGEEEEVAPVVRSRKPRKSRPGDGHAQ